jgi:hypothetical protein
MSNKINFKTKRQWKGEFFTNRLTETYKVGKYKNNGLVLGRLCWGNGEVFIPIPSIYEYNYKDSSVLA